MNRPTILSVIALLAACGGEEGVSDPERVPLAVDEAAAPPAEAGAGTEPPPAAIERVHVLDCGTIEISDLDAFASDGSYAGQTATYADTCYLVRHHDGRTLLWDLGVPAALADGEPFVSPPFTVSLDRTLADQLAEIGTRPDFVAISHSHFDHVAQADAAAGATWLVHEAELAHMEATMAEDQTGGFAVLMAFERETFTGEHDVFGDGSAVIVPMPGHTPGHAVLKLEFLEEAEADGERVLDASRTVLLSGDLYHRTESREGRKVPRFNTDAEKTRESMAAFEALADETQARVIIQHERDDVAALIGGTIE